jgi:hypothetical protein
MKELAEYGGIALGVECAFPAPAHRNEQPVKRLDMMLRRAHTPRHGVALLLRRRLVRRSFR